MRGACPRFLLTGVLVASLFAMQGGGVAAQTSDPPDEGEAGSEPIDDVEEAGEPDTLVFEPPEETAEEDPEPVDGEEPPDEDIENAEEEEETESPDPADEEEGAGEKDEQDEGESEEAQKPPTGGGATEQTPNQAASETNGGASEEDSEAMSSTTASAAQTSPHLADLVAQWYLQGKRLSSTEAGGVSSGNAVGSAQPSLAMLVDALNDADGDGIFSAVETAPAPGADVRFRTSITNIGSTVFEIAGVSHTYSAATGPVRVRICHEAIGLTLRPGQSVPCVISLSDYSPPAGERRLNTITAAGFAIDNVRRGVSDSDTSTVDTISGEFSAVSIEPDSRLLGFTGTNAARLVALGLVLLAAGGGLLLRSGARAGRETMRVDSDPSIEWAGRWATGPDTTRSRAQVGPR